LGLTSSSKISEELEPFVSFGPNDQAGEAHRRPGFPTFAYARWRANERSIIVVLVGHSSNRLVSFTCHPTFMDSLRSFGIAAARH
jgi:hypothetical protein